jgi:hypothetical protein
MPPASSLGIKLFPYLILFCLPLPRVRDQLSKSLLSAGQGCHLNFPRDVSSQVFWSPRQGFARVHAVTCWPCQARSHRWPRWNVKKRREGVTRASEDRKLCVEGEWSPSALRRVVFTTRGWLGEWFAPLGGTRPPLTPEFLGGQTPGAYCGHRLEDRVAMGMPPAAGEDWERCGG